mmetsp:Transcript_17223/g.50029  ORF Transcript_17223/g.50029 Transcript_17223/m.50029 type:complete len:275 (+) Transcript_17223:65-889(+)
MRDADRRPWACVISWRGQRVADGINEITYAAVAGGHSGAPRHAALATALDDSACRRHRRLPVKLEHVADAVLALLVDEELVVLKRGADASLHEGALRHSHWLAIDLQLRVLRRVRLPAAARQHRVGAGGRGGEGARRAVRGDLVLAPERRLDEEHDGRLAAAAILAWDRPHVGRRLLLCVREIDAAAHAPARVGHDAQATLEDGRDHRHVGAVPEEAAVIEARVLREARALAVAVDAPHVAQAAALAGALGLGEIGANELHVRVAVSQGHEVAV